MTTNSWDVLRSKLAPNPQQHQASPILLVAMGATCAGVALAAGSLIMLLGVTGLPNSLADLGEESTWRLILGVACLFVTWSVISNGNNFFGVHRPLGYITCATGALAFVAVARDLATTAANFQVTAAILRVPLTTATTLATFLAGLVLLRAGNLRFARARRYLAQIVVHPRDLRGLGYSVYLRTFGLDDRPVST